MRPNTGRNSFTPLKMITKIILPLLDSDIVTGAMRFSSIYSLLSALSHAAQVDLENIQKSLKAVPLHLLN